MAAALATRDMARVIRIFRQRTGASQEAVGSLVRLPQSRISEIERAVKRVEKLESFERFAEGLGIPPHLLGLAPEPLPPPAARATTPSAPTSAALPARPQFDPRRALRVDVGLLADLDHLTDGFRRIDRRMGAPAVFRDLTAHLARVQDLRVLPMTPATRTRLAEVGSDVAALLGWQALDMDQPKSAWQHFRLAAQAAREAGQPTLHAFVTAQMGYLPLFSGNARAALPLIGQARTIAAGRTSSTFTAWLHAAEAEMLANVGDATAALHALERADAAMSRAAVGEERTPALAHFNASHLLRWKGQVLGHLARKHDAEPTLRAALAEVDPTFVRARAGLLLDLATCLVQDGEVEEACTIAREALAHARETQSARYEHQVLVFRAHLEPWSDTPCVRQLDQELDDDLPEAGPITWESQDVQ